MINIGLFGFGVVGEGIYQVVSEKFNFGAKVKKIAVKHIDKSRNAPDSLFTDNASDILNDESIDLIVELIDDTDAAFIIVSEAMKKGKSVVSANKKMIAENHLELIDLSQENNVSFLYEAAVCGSVPIIRNLEEYFDNDLLSYIQGVVNGSTNFILTKMFEDNATYESVLKLAQDKGFAESNPTLDVEGIDASYKLSIMGLHAFGKRISPDRILRKGITSISSYDFEYAKEKNYTIKLIAKATIGQNGILKELSVLPTFVPANGALGQTNNEFNGILVGGTLANEQLFYGKGAGRYPTASAVLSDISAFLYGYKYGFKKGLVKVNWEDSGISKFYVGFDKRTRFDKELFDSIDVYFEDSNRVYIIGMIQHSKLFIIHPEVSLISYN